MGPSHRLIAEQRYTDADELLRTVAYAYNHDNLMVERAVSGNEAAETRFEWEATEGRRAERGSKAEGGSHAQTSSAWITASSMRAAQPGNGLLRTFMSTAR